MDEKQYINFRINLDTPYKYGPGWTTNDSDIIESVNSTNYVYCHINDDFIDENPTSFDSKSIYNQKDNTEEIFPHPMEIVGTLTRPHLTKLENSYKNTKNEHIKYISTDIYTYCTQETLQTYLTKLENMTKDNFYALKRRLKQNCGVEGNILSNLPYYLKNPTGYYTKEITFTKNPINDEYKKIENMLHAWCEMILDPNLDNFSKLNFYIQKYNLKINDESYIQKVRDSFTQKPLYL